MESYPADPLEGLDYNYAEDSKSGYADSLFSEPSWMEASKTFNGQRPVIPSSELGIPHSYVPKKKKKNDNKDSQSVDHNSTGSHSAKKKFSLPENKFSDPKAAELLTLCRSGWTLSKGQKNKPVMGRINPASVDSDIQEFAERYSDAKSKSSASKGTDLNSIGERFQPQRWPNKDTISFTRANTRKGHNSQMFRAPEVKKSTLGSSSFSFPKDVRMHPEKVRSPGPVFDTTSAYEAILPKHTTPVIGACGRTLAGSIYYDEFNLKSHGNYYHANEAYLNHTSAPAARISSSAILEPKDAKNAYEDDKAESIRSAKNPMTLIRDIRSGKKTHRGGPKFS
jgi:hypothetical protein